MNRTIRLNTIIIIHNPVIGIQIHWLIWSYMDDRPTNSCIAPNNSKTLCFSNYSLIGAWHWPGVLFYAADLRFYYSRKSKGMGNKDLIEAGKPVK